MRARAWSRFRSRKLTRTTSKPCWLPILSAGVFYICNPNNPTGTLTSHSDIEYLVANKPKDSIVLIDEAYIHLSEAPSALDLVKAGKDVIVLRTFSKVYGMAGLRCGFVIARPDLLEKVISRGGQNFMPDDRARRRYSPA